MVFIYILRNVTGMVTASSNVANPNALEESVDMAKQ